MPDDVADEGIATGDEIEIASRHGKLRVRVEAEPPLRRGIASFSHGLGALPREGAKHADASVSRSWPTSTDDVARESIDAMPRMAGFPVSGERTGARAPGSVEGAEGA
jgi:anaerobic selenocysteine-containing dehydrogenase